MTSRSRQAAYSEDKTDQRTDIIPKRVYGSMTIPNAGNYELGPINGFTNLRAQYNEFYFVKADSTDLREVIGQNVGYSQSTLTNRWIPAASESTAQYLQGTCGVPEYVMAEYPFASSEWIVSINMSAPYGLGHPDTPKSSLRCIIHYRRIIEPKIEIQIPNMNIKALS